MVLEREMDLMCPDLWEEGGSALVVDKLSFWYITIVAENNFGIERKMKK